MFMFKTIKCLDCAHCDVDNRKCYPQSRDCKSEYDLNDEDIYKLRDKDCDFFRYKKKPFDN